MQTAIICDLDGTLCDASHRIHHITGDNKDWKAFYDGLVDDPANKWCLDIISSFKLVTHGYKIIFVTGRPESYRDLTEQWFEKNWQLTRYKNFEHKYLFMREDGNHEPDHELKRRIYREQIKPLYNVLFVLEDRQQVVDMYRDEGLTVLQCAKGDF